MQKRDESRSFQPALRPSSAVEEVAVLSPPCQYISYHYTFPGFPFILIFKDKFLN